MAAEATAQERSAVDGLLGAPASGWEGGDRRALDGHVAIGGYRAAAEQRHLLLPALWAVQSAIGWISRGALNYVCERLGVPPADAYGVASFYSLLATEERPDRVAHVCDDVVCRSAGAAEVLDALGDDPGVVTSPCLGQCDRAPAVFFQIAGGVDTTIAPATVEDVGHVLGGATEAIVPQLEAPQTITDRAHLLLLHRIGEIDPGSLDDYRAAAGYEALADALEMGPAGVIEEVKTSNLRGRGGAAFPMGVKWEAVASAPGDTKYVVCNADESEPGTFKDRVLLEGDPFAIIEAMTIAGFAVGAHRGYLYIRGEYTLAQARIEAAIVAAEWAGLAGENILDSGFDFEISVRRGAGAYICGEETALFNSVEGWRGEPRQKPPFPTQAGLFGAPTVVNNVETLANVPAIVLGRGDAYAAVGTPESTGNKLFCLSGHVAEAGVYEVEFGITLGEILELAGGVTGDLAAVLLGGAAGSFVGPDRLDLPLTFEDTSRGGLALGSGVIMPFNTKTDFEDVALRIAKFFRDESCGQCVPCRVGTVRQEEALIRLTAAASRDARARETRIMEEIAAVMRDASICGLGHTAPAAVQSLVEMGLVGS